MEPATMRHRRSSGFTLIELLITVAIIGILMAIALINYRHAIDRARQRRSMADMRSLASAMEAYAIDHEKYPPAAGYSLPVGLSLPTASLASARAYIQPTYLRTVPLVDGWSSWFQYGRAPAGSDFVIRSTGLGGEAQGDPVYGATTSFRDDLILVNGQFVQWPEGVQR